MLKAIARWVTTEERAIDFEHNGVVEGTGFGQYNEKFHFYVGPMALAKRVAAAMNVTAKFTTEELEHMAEALAGK